MLHFRAHATLQGTCYPSGHMLPFIQLTVVALLPTTHLHLMLRLKRLENGGRSYYTLFYPEIPAEVFTFYHICMRPVSRDYRTGFTTLFKRVLAFREYDSTKRSTYLERSLESSFTKISSTLCNIWPHTEK
jgi:hypothetical protein